MKIYKYLKEESYYKTWAGGNFVFTKLTEFLKKEDDHRGDGCEGDLVTRFPPDATIQINGFETPISDYIIRAKPFRLKVPKILSDRIFISSFSEKKDCPNLKKEFGEHVLEIDFNDNLQQKFTNYGFGFGEVEYNDQTYFSTWSPETTYFELAKILGKDNLRKPLLLKREQYRYQEEFRFFFLLKNLAPLKESPDYLTIEFE